LIDKPALDAVLAQEEADKERLRSALAELE